MRWNEYVYQSQLEANRRYQRRMAEKRYGNTQAREKIADRLRNAPEPRDIASGDALNVAYDEINDPRVYAKALKSAGVTIGGKVIRDIPFQYAAAAISTSIHGIMTKGSAPASLKTAEFTPERDELKALAVSIHKKTDVGENPDPADLTRAWRWSRRPRRRSTPPTSANSRERTEATKYLKALHGLLRMMETPAIDLLLAGAEKRPEATLGQLLMFMQAYNLRFGPATTPRQREVYDLLYPKLVAVRSEVAPALGGAAAPATTPPAGPEGAAAGEVFSGMTARDLKRPRAAGAPRAGRRVPGGATASQTPIPRAAYAAGPVRGIKTAAASVARTDAAGRIRHAVPHRGYFSIGTGPHRGNREEGKTRAGETPAAPSRPIGDGGQGQCP